MEERSLMEDALGFLGLAMVICALFGGLYACSEQDHSHRMQKMILERNCSEKLLSLPQ